jgi:hypothetical protein
VLGNGLVDVELTLLRKEALSSRLKHYDPRIRCIAWRCFLTLLPTRKEDKDEDTTAAAAAAAVPLSSSDLHSLWVAAAHAWRQHYAALEKEAFVDPRGADGTVDPTVHNPLSDAQDSIWNVYWQNEELKKEIHRDVVRCYPEIEWFQNSSVQDMLLRVLYVHSKHSKWGYRQGMHELLAPIVLMLHRERDAAAASPPSPSSDDSPVASILNLFSDPQYLEHDAYALLDALLKRSGEWFESQSSPPPASGASSAAPAPPQSSPIVRKCRYIQDALLHKFDIQLHDHLVSISMEPQLYLLRWLRLLFGREFHVEDALLVWDAIFAFDDRLSLADYFCTAMLMFIRTQLIGKDYTSCIRRLLKFPPIEDVSVIVEHALALTKPKPPPVAGESQLSKTAKPNVSLSTGSHTPAKPSPAHGHTIKYAASNTSHVSATSGPMEAASDRVHELELRHSLLAERLQNVIESLQTEVLKQDLSSSISDALVLAIADLKRTKDIAFGFLDINELADLKSSLEALPKKEASSPSPTFSTSAATVSSRSPVPTPTISAPPATQPRAPGPAPEALKIGEGVVDDIFS